jgi:predicted CoA-binding protein
MAQPTVAIIGASSDRRKYGNKSLRAHRHRDFRVFPVNPNESEVEGLPAYRSVADVPVERLDRVSLYVRPEIGLQLIDQIAAKGCEQLWLNPGTESTQLIAKARSLGIEPILGCSIVDLGLSPAQFGE